MARAKRVRAAGRGEAYGAAASTGSAPDSSRFLSGFLGTHVRATHTVAVTTLERAFAPLRMSLTRYAILVHTRELPGTTQTRLAELIGADRTTIVPMLNSMERQGLIHRVRAQHDRRATEIRIAAKGQALLRKLVPLAVAHEKRMTRGLGAAERETLRRLLETVRRNLLAG